MQKVLVFICLFFLPTYIARLIVNLFNNYHVGRNSKVGFSVLLCDKLDIPSHCKIGHLNVIKVRKFKMTENNQIKHLNFIKGTIDIRMDKGSWINSQNKISGPAESYKVPLFWMKKGSVIIMKHMFDVTEDITLGEGCLFAGASTQVWTHAFHLGSERNVRVDGAVEIGAKCYIGASAVICSGVSLADNIVIGANTTVSKSLKESGLYVSQPVRFIPYNADEAIQKLGTPIWKNKVYSRNKKFND